MRVLVYQDLNTRRVEAAFAKVRAAIEADDFRSADVKKLTSMPYWRAKLDYSNRLLLQFARHGQETVCLALEVIENHAYEKSRFLRGAVVDEAKIEQEPLAQVQAVAAEPQRPVLRWLHESRDRFELLDKPIVFDDVQEAVRRLPPPVVVVGSAGSGKTAVTLTKLRQAQGRVLYVTLSAWLAQSARALYDAYGYENPGQECVFLSYRELVETLQVPQGREVTFTAFVGWFERHRQTVRQNYAHALFEEFRGVISASAQGPLDLDTYLALGPRQSLLDSQARTAAHALFQRWRQWLAEAGLFDLNLVAHEWRALAKPEYDFVVVDEVQDLTNVQLALVLACLKKPGEFLLCGDSNQIVHPNFFSWAAVRSLFWQGLAGQAAQRQDLSVLQANFRNTRRVTGLANSLLTIKQARFGSVDRESNFLVQSVSAHEGTVTLVAAKDAALRELDQRTRASAQHAVVVLRDEDKAAARQHFRTPLVFSVHEAKGLEYPSVVLYCMVSGQRDAYAQVCEGVTAADLKVEQLHYSRARDKGDKSLELYKFYVNALYVAMTRASENLVLVESDTTHPLLGLLGLEVSSTQANTAPMHHSSKEEWAQEARKLELQGKEEQAKAIRDTFLKTQPVPWTPWTAANLEELVKRALDPAEVSNKPRQTLFDFALWHGQHAWVEQLAHRVKFAPALALTPGLIYGSPESFKRLKPGEQPTPEMRRKIEELYTQPATQRKYRQIYEMSINAPHALCQRLWQPYTAHNFKGILHQCDQYGVDHLTPTGATPLMMAAGAGNLPLVDALLERGADPNLRDDFGHTAWLAAVSRAMQESDFGKQKLGPLFERIAPVALDVQSTKRLHRLDYRQAEYWVLSLMLAGLKTLRSRCFHRPKVTKEYEAGFFADMLLQTLETLPHHLWQERRRKRSYVSAVLARAEHESQYQPSRKLWMRTKTGFYLPNPSLYLRGHPSEHEEWKNVYDALNLGLVEQGTQARHFDSHPLRYYIQRWIDSVHDPD